MSELCLHGLKLAFAIVTSNSLDKCAFVQLFLNKCLPLLSFKKTDDWHKLVMVAVTYTYHLLFSKVFFFSNIILISNYALI